MKKSQKKFVIIKKSVLNKIKDSGDMWRFLSDIINNGINELEDRSEVIAKNAAKKDKNKWTVSECGIPRR
jgi:hypothetical protein